MLFEEISKLRDELPHLYGQKLYSWQREFIESQNKMLLMCAANQIGKSTIQIKKIITLATDPILQKKFWPHKKPSQFWYFYPDFGTSTTEFFEKWEPDLLPRGSMKNHHIYGWKHDIADKEVRAIHFNSGVSIYFRGYAQSKSRLQTGTVDYVACDEELPEPYYSELQFRLSASNGYFSMVFTATMGQLMWFRAMERIGKDDEMFVGAHKIIVSMYDCIKYEDGTDGHYSLERIEEIKSKCSSEQEVKRRIFGRFIKPDGLKYDGFDYDRNTIPKWKFRADWPVFSAVDPGSGGERGHPAAIIFISMNPNMTEGYVFCCWRGDKITTHAGDVYIKYKELMSGMNVVSHIYDYDARDFSIIDERDMNVFKRAEKRHDVGESIVNTVLACGAIKIVTVEVGGFDDRFNPVEQQKLIDELSNVQRTGDKRHKVDDLADAFRYDMVSIPWNIQELKGEQKKVETVKPMSKLDERRAFFMGTLGTKEENDINSEFDYWNSMYDFD